MTLTRFDPGTRKTVATKAKAKLRGDGADGCCCGKVEAVMDDFLSTDMLEHGPCKDRYRKRVVVVVMRSGLWWLRNWVGSDPSA